MPAAVVAEERLRHEGRRLAVLPGDVLDDVLEPHELVGHMRAARLNFMPISHCPADGDLVVADLDLDARRHEREHHLLAEVRPSVSVGGTGK